MGTHSNKEKKPVREAWEEELFAMHRWGRFSFWFEQDDERGKEEHRRLKKLWKAAQPLDDSCRAIMKQIISLEICNWKLEESILALCDAIGKKEPAKIGIGHYSSITDDRWQKVWAYYLTLRIWLIEGGRGGNEILLSACDPDRSIQNHILEMLGEKSKLKELYVERFSLCLERWLGGYPSQDSAQMKAHNAAVSVIEEEIKKLDPESEVVHELVLKSDGDGRLQPCNHKAFRRYDLIISSIGAGKWRAKMGKRGTNGFERAETLKKYLSPIESWINGQGKKKEDRENELFNRIHAYLGEQNDSKLFLASLLVSLLRSQQLAAKKLAENRMKET